MHPKSPCKSLPTNALLSGITYITSWKLRAIARSLFGPSQILYYQYLNYLCSLQILLVKKIWPIMVARVFCQITQTNLNLQSREVTATDWRLADTHTHRPDLLVTSAVFPKCCAPSLKACSRLGRLVQHQVEKKLR